MHSHRTEPIPQSVSETRHTRALYLLVGLLGIGVAVFLVVWMVGRGDSSRTAAVPAVGSGPKAVSRAQLEALAASTDHPLYWAGPKDGTYELTRTTDGRVYVRYLPSADKVGDRAARYLTVGTYPQKNAFQSIQRAAERDGSISVKLPHGGLLVFDQQAPKSVHFAYPGTSYQVEVYDPSPAEARTLVLANTITSIG